MRYEIQRLIGEPSAFSNTLGVFPSIIATHELVVPKSIPIICPLTLPPELFDTSFESLKYLHTKLRLALTIRRGVVDIEDVELPHIVLVVGGGDVIIELNVDGDKELVLTLVK